MKIPFIFAAVLWLGCAFAAIELSPKTWHVSPDSDPRSSTAHRFVPWNTVQKIRAGMSESEVEALIGSRLQYYHHPANAILYSFAADFEVEVALKLSPTHSIEDISYKKIN